MKCPHCLVEFSAEKRLIEIGRDPEGCWVIEAYDCPNPDCRKLILFLVSGEDLGYRDSLNVSRVEDEKTRVLVHPRGSSRPPTPPEVPKELAEDYEEACIVLPDSPKASAALSRRCLQNLLREAAKEYYEKALEVCEKAGRPAMMFESFTLKRFQKQFPIRVYLELGDVEKSKTMIDNVYRFAHSVDDRELMATADVLRALQFYAQKKWEESIKHFERGCQQLESLNLPQWDSLLNRAPELFQKIGAKKDIERTMAKKSLLTA